MPLALSRSIAILPIFSGAGVLISGLDDLVKEPGVIERFAGREHTFHVTSKEEICLPVEALGMPSLGRHRHSLPVGRLPYTRI
jgi:hypothetical protein